MLAISAAASDAISTALEGAAVPDGAGLRLATGPATEQGVAIEIAFVRAAGPDDQVIETEPADVFVEPAIAELLDDQVLDAGAGPDGTISFTLRPQAGAGGAGPGAA